MGKQIILNVLNEMGFVVLENEEDDFNLQDYIVDSLQFVEFIVGIEEAIGLTLTENFLDYNLLLSFQGFSEKLKEYMEKSINQENTQDTAQDVMS